MKKLICALLSVFVMGTASFAQSGNAAKTPVPQAKTTGSMTNNKMAGQKGVKETAKADDKKAGPKMKKDGTPDMRHAENKKAAAPTQKLKKDGTPDMRYKENKKAAATKKAA